MYNQFYGVHKNPFNLTPDPEFLYLTSSHREALAGLSYAIFQRKGFVVLTGDAGTGKTTLLTRILQHLPAAKIHRSVIVNPTLSRAEFLEAAMLDFGFSNIPASKAQRISELKHALWNANRQGCISALIVDEAHKLTFEVIEEIRLLGNFESTSEKLLQIVLVGQRELDDLLNGDALRQFKQRIAMRMKIEPLSVGEVGQYIQHRWTVAGGKEAPFSAEAVAGIGQATKGIPRLINVTCDNALMEAYADGSVTVEVRHVIAACRDLQLPIPGPQLIAPAARTTPGTEEFAGVSAVDAYPVKTLERYGVTAGQTSVFSWIRNKFRSTERTETA